MEPFQTLYPGRPTKITSEAGWRGQTKKPAWKRNLHPLIVQVAARKASSEAALAELIEQISPQVIKIIRRLAPEISEYEADSIANLVFMKVWCKGASYIGKPQPGLDPDLTAAAWLERIIRNECYSYLRELRKLKEREIQEADLGNDPAEDQGQADSSVLDKITNQTVSANPGISTEAYLIEQEQCDAFRTTLSNEHNHILDQLMVDYKGSEIAHELGISEAAVSQKRNTIKRKYQQFIEDYDQD